MSELAWPMDDESRLQAQEWANGITSQVLDWTWRAFDIIRAGTLGKIDLTQPLEQLERDLARHHFREINILWAQETSGECAFTPHHEYPELETRSPAPAKPPAYDIAFVSNANPRSAWPIEAKVVQTSGALADYLGDVKKFTDGIAAPLSGIGAQIAYLLAGTSDAFFNNLRTRLSLSLQTSSEFSARAHRVSSHRRKNHPDLQLHHMAMACHS
jgi:hypothetical protein